MERYVEGKSLVKDMIEYFKERVSAEEAYIKALAKMNKGISTREDDKSTLVSCWLGVKSQSDATLRMHATLGTQLEKNILNQLTALKTEQSKTKNALEAAVDKLNKDLAKSIGNLTKAKKNYYQVSEELDKAVAAVERAQNDISALKEMTKLRAKVMTLEKEKDKADVNYKTSVQEHQSFQQKYEQEMKRFLTQFQQLEEKRLESVKQYMENYQSFVETAQEAFAQSVTALKAKVTALNTRQDLQEFLNVKQTGMKPPPLIEYEPYGTPGSHPQHKMSVSSSSENIPNFDANNMPQRHEPTASFSPPTGNTGWQADFSGSSFPTPVSSSSSNSLASSGNLSNSSQSNSFFGNPSNPPSFVTTPSSNTIRAPTPTPIVAAIDPKTMPPPMMQPMVAVQTQPPPQKNYKMAKVSFSYTAEESNEIDLKEGEIITILAMDESGWWIGQTSSGKEGLFPGNYVQVLPDTVQQLPPPITHAPIITPPVQGGMPPVLMPSNSGNSINGFGTTIPMSVAQPPPPVTTTATPMPTTNNLPPIRNTVKLRKCLGLYDFTTTNDDELAFLEGESLSIVSEAEGWYFGFNMQGKQGMFPANFVKVVD